MSRKELSKMSRYEMVDIIYTLQKNEQELEERLAASEELVKKLQEQLSSALEVTLEALDVRAYLEAQGVVHVDKALSDEVDEVAPVEASLLDEAGGEVPAEAALSDEGGGVETADNILSEDEASRVEATPFLHEITGQERPAALNEPRSYHGVEILEEDDMQMLLWDDVHIEEQSMDYEEK